MKKRQFAYQFVFHSLNIHLIDFWGSRGQIPDLALSYFVFF